MGTPIDLDRWTLYRDTIENLLAEGYTPIGARGGGKGSAVSEAARRLEMDSSDLASWCRIQQRRAAASRSNRLPNWGLYQPRGAAPNVASPITDTPADRRETHDSSFWKRRASELQKDLARVEHTLEQMAGLRDQPSRPAEWLLPKAGKQRKAVIGLLVSDVHAGEVVAPDEILGLNAYDVEICRRRVRRMFAAACEIGPRWLSDCEGVGALLVLAGDLVSGDIHEELRITNALTSHEQVLFCVEEIAAGLRHMCATFDRVHVVSVPGNHGRTTPKPTAKLYSRLSYDTLIARMLADRFASDKRVSFQVGASRDAVVPVLGRTVFVNHGDGMGTGGGMGFIGPLAPIVRGTKKVEAQQARANRRPDLILHGHYHTSANPGPVLSNGSIVGYSEYGSGLRSSAEAPMQWLFLIHERWGLRDRLEIKLEDPVPPPMPVVRVPAVMRNA